MYAQTRYMPRQSRTVSLGAAFAINGLILAAFVYAVPKLVPHEPPTVLKIKNVPIDPVPPIDPVEKPKADKPVVPQEPLLFAPKPVIDTPVSQPIDTTDVMPPAQPPIVPIDKIGPPVLDPPAPLPPLVGAVQDPRFARDFQPEYPSAELRAQRDGVVRVRVLIGADGRVKQVEPVSATSDAFFDATRRQALAKWRFKPATRGGVPEESWKVMSVRFELTNR